jgi:hypothetical protein
MGWETNVCRANANDSIGIKAFQRECSQNRVLAMQEALVLYSYWYVSFTRPKRSMPTFLQDKPLAAPSPLLLPMWHLSRVRSALCDSRWAHYHPLVPVGAAPQELVSPTSPLSQPYGAHRRASHTD